MMNERCLEILGVLLRAKKPLLVREIAQELNRSTRSVQYHLKFLEDSLREMHLPPLRRSARNGIRLSDDVRDNASLCALLSKRQGSAYAATPKEREAQIFFFLLSQPGYVSMEHLAKHLSVSRATIVRDVRHMKSCARRAGFCVATAPNHGICLAGSESAIRAMAFRLSSQRMQEETALAAQDARRDRLARVFVGQLAAPDVSFFEDCLHASEGELEVLFSESGFSSIVLWLAIATLRLRGGHTLPASREGGHTTRAQAAASRIARRLSERFCLEVSRSEQDAIAMQLSSSALSADKRAFDPSELMLYTLAGRILGRIGILLEDAAMARDERLFQSFFAHLRPAVSRLRQGIRIENPLLAQIRAEYGWLFPSAREALVPAEAWAGGRFPDEEIAYFVLHFGAALERHGRLVGEEKRHVLIVCDHGIGTSELIAAKVRRFFSVEIIATVSRRQAQKVLEEAHVDLVVTTVELPDAFLHFSGAPQSLLVSPLLTQRDILRLGSFLPLRRRSADSLLQGIMQAVTRHAIILDSPRLLEELSVLLDTQEGAAFQKGEMPMLEDVLTEDCIALGVKAKDWEAAVRCGGAMMQRLGMVEERYTEAMLRTVREMGAYIVIAPGLAMPHARPEDGARRVGTVILTLEHPVPFGNADYDPVRVVVFLCAVDKVQHLKVLSDLMALFEDDGFCDEICALHTEQEAHAYVIRKLQDAT